MRVVNINIQKFIKKLDNHIPYRGVKYYYRATNIF